LHPAGGAESSKRPAMRLDNAPAITGLGTVSALGVGCEELFASVERGTDGISPLCRLELGPLGGAVAGQVPEDPRLRPAQDRCTSYALTAAHEAWRHARVAEAGLEPTRIGLVLGTSTGDGRGRAYRSTEAVARALGVQGPCLTVSTACSSSTTALGLARDLLRMGAVDLVLAGGSDELLPELLAGFSALGVLSSSPCAPFSTPVGMNMGEGAGFAVLEPAAAAHRRGVPPLAYLLGYALSADAYHPTSPHPAGRGVAHGLAAALDDAGLSPEAVGYVNMHGTGTAAGDPAEWLAVQRVLGPAFAPVSSSKSFLGHAQGAAGILEAALTVWGLGAQAVPPTLHFVGPRPGCPRDPVAGQGPRPHSFDVALSISSAFAGANSVVALGGAATGPPDREALPLAARSHGSIAVIGAGVVSAAGSGLRALQGLEAAAPASRPISGRVGEISLAKLRGVDPRGLDPSERFVLAAAAEALKEGGVQLRGGLRDRAGLILGATHPSPASAAAFHESIRRRGLAQPSAAAFHHMVLNAPAGACTVALDLRGPTTTVTTGRGSGLVALVLAAQMLASRTDADLLVAGGYDELPSPVAPAGASDSPRGEDTRPPVALHRAPAEGAAVLLLARCAEEASQELTPVLLTGWALAGPGQVARAAARACELARLSPHAMDAAFCPYLPGELGPDPSLQSLPWEDLPATLGYAPAAGSAMAAVMAFGALRRGGCHRALVISAEGSSATAAVVLERRL